MFYITILAMILTVLWAVAYIIGMILPQEHTATRAATFRQPPAEIFPLIAGPQEWRTQSEPVPTEAGAPRRWKEMSRHGAMIFEEARSEPPRIYQMRIVGDNLPFGGTWTFELSPEGIGTRLRMTEQGRVKPPLFRFISRFIIGHTRTIDGYLHGLGEKLGEDVVIEP